MMWYKEPSVTREKSMKTRLFVAVLAVASLVGCNISQPTEPDGSKPNLTTATLVSSTPIVGSQVTKGNEVAVTIAFSYDVTAVLTQNVEPRLWAHRAGDPATMWVGGTMFPHGNSYMELPPKGNLTLTFDGDLGGRAFHDAEPGTTIDYATLVFMYKKADGRLDFVDNVDGKGSRTDSAPIFLSWNVK
jgi:hypothetical protein